MRIEQGQGRFSHAQKKLGRQCDAHGNILDSGDGVGARDDSTLTRNLSTCENAKQLNSYTRFLDLVATTLALDLVVIGLQMFRVEWLVLDM